MPRHDTAQLDGIPRKTLAMRGEALRKKIAEPTIALGPAIERALELAHLTRQEASHAMGYRDPSALSRWISGAERPQFERLFAVPRLKCALVIALAELAEGIEITTQITIRRRA